MNGIMSQELKYCDENGESLLNPDRFKLRRFKNKLTLKVIFSEVKIRETDNMKETGQR